MAEKYGTDKTNIEWLTEQAALLRQRVNPCAGQTPLTAMADRFENTVMEIKKLSSNMMKACVWEPESEDTHLTGCDKNFTFTDGGVADNGFEFCPFCGGHITFANEADS